MIKASQNPFTCQPAVIRPSLFLGVFETLVALQAAHPTAQPGNWAIVQIQDGPDLIYLWDTTESTWVTNPTGNFNQNNKIREVFIGFANNRTERDALLNSTNIEVADDENVIVTYFTPFNQQGGYVQASLLWKLGKGNYTPIGSANFSEKFFELPIVYPTEDSMNQLITAPNAVVREYGTFTGSIIDFINAAAPVDFDDETKVYYIRANQAGITYLWRFNGDNDTYGTGEAQMSADAIELLFSSQAQGTQALLFTALTDTPASYEGQAGKVLVVKVGEDGLEFVPLPGASVPNLQQVLEQGASFSKSQGTATSIGQLGDYNAGQNSFRDTSIMTSVDGDITRITSRGGSKAGYAIVNEVLNESTEITKQGQVGILEGSVSLDGNYEDINNPDNSQQAGVYINDGELKILQSKKEGNNLAVLKLNPGDGLFPEYTTADDEEGEQTIATREWVEKALPYKLRKLSTETFSESTSKAIIDFLEIPAGSLQNGKDYVIEVFFTKSNTAQSNFYIEFNTSNSLSGAQQYARVQGASAQRTMVLNRKVWINSSNIITVPAGTNNLITNTGNAFNFLDPQIYAANLANPIFILATCENADTTTVSGVIRMSINEV
jgi:hypothetical protein